jgi:outer membrane receptor protein involved in Fe transport
LRLTSRFLFYLSGHRAGALLLALLMFWAVPFAVQPVRAQENADTGTVSGVVVESALGRPIVGATVLVRGLTLATTTDLLGRYTLRGVPAGTQTFIFSKSGYVRGVVTDIRVLPGQISNVDVPLRPEYYEMEEFEVTAEELKEQEVELLSARQKAAAVSDAIGADTFSRYASSDAADIVAKVAGTTVVDGKFAIIRGLSDRYTSATLNGAEVPSADPYRKSVQLDLFPAGQIDRLVVTKTFTPDQPGNFTGGNVNIVTKSFPEKLFFNFSTSVSYNDQSNLRDDFLVTPGHEASAFSLGEKNQEVPPALENPNLQIPEPPGTAGRRETLEEAQRRRAQADALARLTKALGPTKFSPEEDDSPLNHSYSASAGLTTNVFGRPLGLFASANYGRSFSMYQNGVSARYDAALNPSRVTDDTRAQMTTEYGGSGLIAYQFSPEHEVSFNFLVNQNIEDEARTRVGKNFRENTSDTLVMQSLRYTERQLQAYQLKGNHLLPELADWRIDWLASYSLTSQEEPDYRLFNFYITPDGRIDTGASSLPQPDIPTRYFRDLKENNLNLRLDNTVPFKDWRELDGELRFGAFMSASEREFEERTFSYRGSAPWDESGTLAPGNLGYIPEWVSGTRTNYNFRRYITSKFGNSSHTGELDVFAGYLMATVPIAKPLRFVGGARYETTYLEMVGTEGGSLIEEAHLLPAAGLVYTIRTNMNVRFNFAQTIARPLFREIAPYTTFDPVEGELLVGNPALTMTEIDNWDLRWEWFVRPGEILSASIFYKDLASPIEKKSVTLDGDKVTFENRDAAKLYGVELEARKGLGFLDDLLAEFSVGLNVAYIKSEVELTREEITNKRAVDPSADDVRPLFDQSPYIINTDLTYDHRKLGTAVTILANITGERLYLTRGVGEDVYEHPAPTLDLVVSQKLGKHWKAKFSVKNLLDPEFKRTYGDDPNDPAYTAYRRGRTYSISLSAEF